MMFDIRLNSNNFYSNDHYFLQGGFLNIKDITMLLLTELYDIGTLCQFIDIHGFLSYGSCTCST